MKLIDFKKKKTSMHRKLLLYMLALVIVVVTFIAVGLFFVGQFSTTKEKYSNNLSFQNEFYTRQTEKFFDDLSMMSEMLANDSSAIIDDYLNTKGKVNDMNECTYLGRICTDLVLNKKAMDDKENYWTRFRLALSLIHI